MAKLKIDISKYSSDEFWEQKKKSYRIEAVIYIVMFLGAGSSNVFLELIGITGFVGLVLLLIRWMKEKSHRKQSLTK